VYKTIRKQLTAPETVKWSTVPRDDGSREKFPATAARQNDSNENSRGVAATSVHPTVGGFPDDVQYPKTLQHRSPNVVDATETAASHHSDGRTAAVPETIPLDPGQFQTAPGSNSDSQTNSDNFLSFQTDCLTTGHKIISHSIDKQFSTLLHNEICIVRYPKPINYRLTRDIRGYVTYG